MPSFTSIITSSLLAISAFAYTTPTTFNQTSNPVFTPTLGQRVPVSQSFKITWQPTESGTVSIVLLRGPSANVQPLYAIAEMIPNSGSFEWFPKSDLEDDTSRYGLQVIIDANGQFQYSVQFGISNPDYKPSSSSSMSSAMSTHSATATATGSAPVYTSVEPTTSSYVTVSHTVKSSTTSLVYITTSQASTMQTSVYAPMTTSTIAVPTYGGNSTVPTGTGLPVPLPTGNAASSIKVAGGLMMGVVGVAAYLL